MKNYTQVHLPGPTSKVKINLRQQPGFTYPHPVNRAWITESNIHPSLPYNQPHWNEHQRVY
jgi:hypothetical protein